MASDGSSLETKQVSGANQSVNITNTSVAVTGTFFQSTQPISIADTLDVRQVSGANWSVSVIDIFGSTATSMLNGDNRLRVAVDTGSSGLTDTELRASHIDVVQMSGAIDSMYVTGVAASTYAEILNPDGRVKVELPTGSSGLTDSELRASSIDVQQASGASWSTNVLTMPAVVVTSITNTIATANIDSSGVQYSGSNPVPVLIVPNTTSSTYVVGALAHDAADDGANPVKVGGVAKQTNPTAVADGDVVRFVADDIGRQVMTVHQVRDLIVTARVNPTTVAPTILLAGGGAGVFHDLISITASNKSTAATTAVGASVAFDLLEVLAGGPVLSFSVGNGRSITYQPPAPIRQSEGGSAWMVDITSDATTGAGDLIVTALFAKNV